MQNAILMCLTETHLHSDIEDAEVTIVGYEIFRADRSKGKKKGGVAAYVRTDVAHHTRLMSSGSNGEAEYVVLHIAKWNLVVVTLYRPPGCTTEKFIEVTEIIRSNIRSIGNPEPTIVITGDFNLPNIEWNRYSIYGGTSPDRTQADALFRLVDELLLRQIVENATRGDNILDLFLTNNDDLVSNIQIEDTIMSDHRILMIETTMDMKPDKLGGVKKSGQFASLNFFNENTKWTDINNHISSINWDQAMKGLSTEEMYVFFQQTLFQICEMHTPGKRHPRKSDIPKDRKILLRKKTKLTKRIEYIGNEAKLKRQLNDIEEKLAQSHENELLYEEQKAVEAIKINTKYFYHYVKKRAKVRNIIGPIKHEGELIYDSSQISEVLNKQYESVFSRTKYTEEKEWQPMTPSITDSELTDIKFTTDDIQRSISAIRTYAAAGPDQIPAVVLKKCAHTVCTPIYNLWRNSLNTSTIPKKLKRGIITPIYKGGDRTEAKNYRPVALTSHIIKIFERIVVERLQDYMEENRLYNATQHGFRKGRSCLSQLLQHQFNIINLLENGATADVIYLDFSKAFDKVDHIVLLKKILHLGIKDNVLNWIKCFLTDRDQSVVVDGAVSENLNVLSGVAQGSVMGPMLFLIYITDIDINMRHCTALSFADDTRLLGAVRTEDDYTSIQEDLQTMFEWAEKNNMTFNSSKFEMLRYSHPKLSVSELCYVTPDGTTIKQCSHLRDLGIIMNQNANFDQQIENTVKKAKQTMGWILRSFRSREPTMMMTLFKAMVIPLLEYCCQLWNPTTIGEIRKLEAVQRTFTARIKNMDKLNYWQRLSHLELYSLERRRERYIILYIWKIINGLVPNFKQEFAIKTTDSGRRGTICVIPPILKTWKRIQNIKESSIAVHGPRLYNCLPQNLRNEKLTLNEFKQRLDKFLKTIEDKPSLPHYQQITIGNSLLHRLIPAHRGWRTSAT